MNYPCIGCILRCNCSRMCPEVWKHKIFNSMIKSGSCPDCEGKEINVHEVTKVFWVVSCCTCMSRFTLDFKFKLLTINRSHVPKGGIRKFKGKALSFTNTTYSTFIMDMRKRGWGREGYGSNC